MITEPTCVALIPARSGSARVPGKNVRLLAGHPLIAYSITSALDAGLFAAVVVSTDDKATADIACRYGADVPFLRPDTLAGARSPDIEWVEHALTSLRNSGRSFDCFAILRPTSPFRTAETIRRAWSVFRGTKGIDSLRAVERVSQHPGKMWIIRGDRLLPLLPFGPSKQPWHSSQMPSLPEVWVQNASLEIAWTSVVTETRTIAGHTLVPFITEGHEGFDINELSDWWVAEELVRQDGVALPVVSRSPSSRLVESAAGSTKS